MLKEQIAEVLREALKSQIDSCLELYGETGMNYPNLQPNDRELGYYADQILALFSQGEAQALKEQMEGVIRVIDRRIAEQERVFDLAVRTKTNAKLQVLKALKAELLEGENERD